jgi:tetratricopeptide (TPR) repeat protein
VGSAADIAATYLRAGSQAALTGHFVQAADFYQEAAALTPRNVEAWICLGSARADADDRAGALAALEHARSIAPDSPDAYRALARARLRFGQYAEARQAAEQALQRAPDDPYSVVTLGLARAESIASSADEAAAESLMKRALAIGDHGPEPYYGLGLVALHRNRPREAVLAFRAAVQHQPDSPTMHYRLASAYRLAGQPRESERELQSFRRLTQRAQAGAPPPSAMR